MRCAYPHSTCRHRPAETGKAEDTPQQYYYSITRKTKPKKTASEVRKMTVYHHAVIVGLVLLASQVNEAAALANSSRHRNFADDPTTILYTEENECSSALGVSMTFFLIYLGCTGDVVNQIHGVLSCPTGSNMQLVWEEITKRMLSNAMGQCVVGEWDGVCDSAAPMYE